MKSQSRGGMPRDWTTVRTESTVKKQTRQIGHNNHYKNLERHTADTIVS